MTKHVFTEATIEKAMGLIQKRNVLVKQVEKVRAQITAFGRVTRGILSIAGKDLQVMITPNIFDVLAQPITDEIERINSELKDLGIVTIDEEMVG